MESAIAHAHHCHKIGVSQTVVMAKTREKSDGTRVLHGASRNLKCIASEQALAGGP